MNVSGVRELEHVLLVRATTPGLPSSINLYFCVAGALGAGDAHSWPHLIPDDSDGDVDFRSGDIF